jgi:uncharacterized protein
LTHHTKYNHIDIELVPVVKLLKSSISRFIIIETNDFKKAYIDIIRIFNKSKLGKELLIVKSDDYIHNSFIKNLKTSKNKLFFFPDFDKIIESPDHSLFFNQARNFIFKNKISLLILIPFGSHQYIARKIPDLWSFRSYKTTLVYSFSTITVNQIENFNKDSEPESNSEFNKNAELYQLLKIKYYNSIDPDLKKQLIIQLFELSDLLGFKEDNEFFESELIMMLQSTELDKINQRTKYEIENPFVSGRIARGENFINRKNEIRSLTKNITNRINTIITAPRRWGKTSLIKKTLDDLANNKSMILCYVDVLPVNSLEEFLSNYANSIILAVSNTENKILRSIKNFFSQSLIPRISINDIGAFQITFEFKNPNDYKNIEEVLQLPEKLALVKSKQFIICIDEFHNIVNIDKKLQFYFRSIAQHQSNVTYIFSGSQTHMIQEIFANPNNPLFRFADVILLEKIKIGDFSLFIKEKFQKSGKIITDEKVNAILQITRISPYYVNYICNMIWSTTKKVVTNTIIEAAIDEVLSMNSPLYDSIFKNLTFKEKQYLYRLSFSERDNNDFKEINKSTFFQKNLIEKDILFLYKDAVDFSDPFFAYWISQMDILFE